MTLSLDTAYRSFGGEVEASSTPTICRLPDSRRHQLSAIAPTHFRGWKANSLQGDNNANEAKFARSFKGLISNGNMRVRSLLGQPHIPVFGEFFSQLRKARQMRAFLIVNSL